MTERVAETYSPAAHLAGRYPTWWITTADLNGLSAHVVCTDAKLIIVDPAAFDGCRDWAFAHIAYHLEEHMMCLTNLTEEMCSQADYLAQVNMRHADPWDELLTG